MSADKMDFLLEKSYGAHFIDLFSLCVLRVGLAEQPKLLCWKRHVSEPENWRGHSRCFGWITSHQVVFWVGSVILICCPVCHLVWIISLAPPVLEELNKTPLDLMRLSLTSFPYLTLMDGSFFSPFALLRQVCDTFTASNEATREMASLCFCNFLPNSLVTCRIF